VLSPSPKVQAVTRTRPSSAWIVDLASVTSSPRLLEIPESRDVARVGSAAAADQRQRREPLTKRSELGGEQFGIALVELVGGVELLVAE
jgi:hypothetical protein